MKRLSCFFLAVFFVSFSALADRASLYEEHLPREPKTNENTRTSLGTFEAEIEEDYMNCLEKERLEGVSIEDAEVSCEELLEALSGKAEEGIREKGREIYGSAMVHAGFLSRLAKGEIVLDNGGGSDEDEASLAAFAVCVEEAMVELQAGGMSEAAAREQAEDNCDFMLNDEYDLGEEGLSGGDDAGGMAKLLYELQNSVRRPVIYRDVRGETLNIDGQTLWTVRQGPGDVIISLPQAQVGPEEGTIYNKDGRGVGLRPVIYREGMFGPYQPVNVTWGDGIYKSVPVFYRDQKSGEVSKIIVYRYNPDDPESVEATREIFVGEGLTTEEAELVTGDGAPEHTYEGDSKAYDGFEMAIEYDSEKLTGAKDKPKKEQTPVGQSSGREDSASEGKGVAGFYDKGLKFETESILNKPIHITRDSVKADPVVVFNTANGAIVGAAVFAEGAQGFFMDNKKGGGGGAPIDSNEQGVGPGIKGLETLFISFKEKDPVRKYEDPIPEEMPGDSDPADAGPLMFTGGVAPIEVLMAKSEQGAVEGLIKTFDLEGNMILTPQNILLQALVVLNSNHLNAKARDNQSGGVVALAAGTAAGALWLWQAKKWFHPVTAFAAMLGLSSTSMASMPCEQFKGEEGLEKLLAMPLDAQFSGLAWCPQEAGALIELERELKPLLHSPK